MICKTTALIDPSVKIIPTDHWLHAMDIDSYPHPRGRSVRPQCTPCSVFTVPDHACLNPALDATFCDPKSVPPTLRTIGGRPPTRARSHSRTELPCPTSAPTKVPCPYLRLQSARLNSYS
ncbi:hypothetical protein EJ07DRAFT_150326 [Lizonia empirigonia]|nr:hypothetical protein EJ07DRAFT_150326 [Lizonia empirigonia]